MTEDKIFREDTQPPTAPPFRLSIVRERRVAARLVGRFELLGDPMEGGEGFTWLARHTTSDSGDNVQLAVKQLRRPPGAPPSWPSRAELDRLESHRIVLTSLRARHLVPVVDVFVAPPAAVEPGAGGVVPYVVMTWIAGPSLAEHLRGEPVTAATLAERLTRITELAEAVSALHSKSTVGGAPLVHRDVKPQNCIVSPDSGLVLVDVSSLRSVVDGYDPAGMRTPEYAAPEVLADPRATREPSSDVYSVGAVAYFCLTGEQPSDVPASLNAVLGPLRLPDRDAFVLHLRTALDEDPAKRPADLVAWARELRRLGTPRARFPRLRRLLPAAAAAVAVAMVAWGGAVYVEDQRDARSVASTGPASKNSDVVRITAPAPRAGVPRCQEIDGTSRLPAGRTLITTMRNLSSGDPEQYPEPVVDWQTPSDLQAWHGLQYFGQVDGALGQTYRITVYSVPLTLLRAQVADVKKAGDLWWFTSVPAGWTVEAWIDLRRVAGTGVC